MKTIINKTVNLDVEQYCGNDFVIIALFKHQAKKEHWTKVEIDTVIKEAKRLSDYDHMVTTIQSHCEVKTDKIDAKEVWEVLSQLGHHTHYLASKPIENWDKYDRANYKSLQIKSGKLKKVYGVYDTAISQDDIENVTTHPNFFFNTREEADAVMQEMIVDGQFKPREIHVLYRYKKHNNK